MCKGGWLRDSADWGIVAFRIHRPTLARAPIPPSRLRRATRLRVGPLCRCATSPHTVGSHPLHKGGFGLAQPYPAGAQIKFIRRGRRPRRPGKILRNRKLPLTTPLNQALSVSFLQRVHRNLSKISHRRPRFCRQTGRSARAYLLSLSSRVSQNEIFTVSSQ